jgi:hypothetical protein
VVESVLKIPVPLKGIGENTQVKKGNRASIDPAAASRTDEVKTADGV